MQSNKITMKLFCIGIIVIMIVACSCNNLKSKPFDKDAWTRVEDPLFPPSNRKFLVKDVVKNRIHKGMSRRDLIELLGVPDFDSNTELNYRIIVDYGGDIDPTYTQDLKIYFSKDSTISDYEIKEWRK